MMDPLTRGQVRQVARGDKVDQDRAILRNLDERVDQIEDDQEELGRAILNLAAQLESAES